MSKIQLLFGAAPRGVLGPIQANARLPHMPRIIPDAVLRASGYPAVHAAADDNPGGFLKRLGEDFDAFKARQAGEVTAMKAELGELRAISESAAMAEAAARLGGAPGAGQPVDPAYSELFTSTLRGVGDERALQIANASGDRQMIKAAMSEGVDSGGGYVAPIEWDRKIAQKQRIFSPMRRLATVIQTSVRGYSTVWSDGAWGSGWVGETAVRPATTNPTLASLPFSAGQIYAFPQITQDLLDDADFDANGWLQGEVADTFSLMEGVAFQAGDGANKPRGLLTYVTGGSADGVHPGGNLTVVTSTVSGSFTADNLIDFVFSHPSVYRVGAAWLMNSATAGLISKLKDSEGRYIWSMALVAGQPNQLLGYPVEIDENMPNVGAGALAIAFGDFKRAYIINDRQGVTVMRDPFSNKPFVGFYCRKRVGAGVWDPNAVRLLKIAAS